jgi:hypothetical protein
MAETPTLDPLQARVRDYLGKGGLFNPELMSAFAVRDLVMDLSAALALERQQHADEVQRLTANNEAMAQQLRACPEPWQRVVHLDPHQCLSGTFHRVAEVQAARAVERAQHVSESEFLAEQIAALTAERDTLKAEIAEAREACPHIRIQDHFDAPLLTLISLEVSRGFNRDSALAESRAALSTAQAEIARLKDAGEMLWVVVANVSGGDWSQQSAEWQAVAAQWRDNYFAALSSPTEDQQ